jgi:hypothetical protein
MTAFPPSYDLTIGTRTKSTGTDLVYKTVKKYSSPDTMLLRLTLADFSLNKFAPAKRKRKGWKKSFKIF